MATQAIVDAVVKLLTDNGYTAPADTSQLSSQIDSFVSSAGFTPSAPTDDDEAEEAQATADDQAAIDADKADEASKQADIDARAADETAEDSPKG